MADVIQLARHRSGRAGARPPTVVPTLFFDLASPETYLVAERIERRFAEARWCPARPWEGTPRSTDLRRPVAAAERRAHDLHMPLVWPERFPAPVPSAMRVALLAAERGRGGAFAIAAGRLAFCGGFDIENPHILAEAAAAAGLDVGDALAAASALERDEQIATAGRTLWVEGGSLPALRHDGRLFCGEQRITAAVITSLASWSIPPSAS